MKAIKILFVGNSFAVDTTHYAAEIAIALGVESVKIGTLYVPGCSIEMHYDHAMRELPAYVYHVNCGEGWTSEPEYTIRAAIQSDSWDWIVIQHGTHGTARYTSPECYDRLTPLIQYIKSLAPGHTKIAFNLTWMGESTRQHHEILSYEGDIAAMRARLEEVTRQTVLANPYVDLLIPTGTAIENARTSRIGLLTRDCYHLSMDKGRYIAALTMMGSVTGLPVDQITWTPKGVDDYARRIAIESASHAFQAPLSVTPSEIFE